MIPSIYHMKGLALFGILFGDSTESSHYTILFLDWHQGLRMIHSNQKAHGPQKKQGSKHLSHEKQPPTFHYTGWLIGILLAYCN